MSKYAWHLWLVVLMVCLAAWFANVAKLMVDVGLYTPGPSHDVLRLVGVFFPPIGVVIGFF